MNNNERYLLRYICNGDLKNAQIWAKNILDGISSKVDENFRDELLEKLAKREGTFIELPSNMQGLLIAEDSSLFPIERYIVRESEEQIVNSILDAYAVSQELAELGIKYTPTLMLHGVSGGGKTTLARYIAYKADLPFIYVKFSNLVSSYLGSTQTNITKIFDFAKTRPCVLCFDEIDAVGMARGQKNDVGEMNRIVITLMQELDNISNNVILIGTTNRFDRLDDALIRRFTIKSEVFPLNATEVCHLVQKFFDTAKIDTSDWLTEWLGANFPNQTECASTVIEKCTQKLVSILMLNKKVIKNQKSA